MSYKDLDMPIAQVVANAPHSREFYEQFDEDTLEYIEARWPTKSGYVCVVINSEWPGRVMVRQTPDIGLLESWGYRSSPYDTFKTVGSRHFADRFEALDLIRERVGAKASDRRNHVARIAEWFVASPEEAIAALDAN